MRVVHMMNSTWGSTVYLVGEGESTKTTSKACLKEMKISSKVNLSVLPKFSRSSTICLGDMKFV